MRSRQARVISLLGTRSRRAARGWQCVPASLSCSAGLILLAQGLLATRSALFQCAGAGMAAAMSKFEAQQVTRAIARSRSQQMGPTSPRAV